MARKEKSLDEQKALIEKRIASVIRQQEENAAKLVKMKKALCLITEKKLTEEVKARQQRLMEVGEIMEYLLGRELHPETVRDSLAPIVEQLKACFPAPEAPLERAE